jgi:hypothetical protein
MYLSTLLVTSTLGVGTSFAITNGTTTGTTSTAPQYPLDVSGTARTATLQYYDNSASFSEQSPLNYTVLGQTWTPSSIQPAEWNSVAMSANGQYQVACVLVGGIWYSSTYGTTWTQSSASSLAWYSIALSGSGQYACACVSNGSIWYSSTYGQTWTTSGVTTALWRSVAMSTNGQYVVACASNGALWYSSTYGQTWTQSTTSGTTAAVWSSVAMSATGQYVYACVNGGGIWYSTTYGQTWTVTSAPSSVWSSIAVSANGQYASACVNGGLIWYSTNYGQTWASTATTNTWGSIVMSASGQYQLASTILPFLLYNYRFNVGDTQGSLLLNYATGQYDATLVNSAIITTASYKTGSASLSLTPTYSQYVNLPPFVMTSSIGSITFCCWINLNSSVGTWARIFDISRGLKGTTFPGTSYSFLCGYTPGVLNFYTGTETNAGQSTLGHYTTPYTPSTGTWTHVAWVLTGSSWTIYINGSVVTPTVGTAVTQYLPPTGAYPYFFIGRSSWVADVYGYGNYNDFRMYSIGLSSQQISDIYNAGNGIIGSQVASTNFGASWTTTVPSLLYNYRFTTGDVQGVTTLNAASGQFDATLVNGPTLTTSTYKAGTASIALLGSSSQYVQLPAFTMTSTITGITISCWINFATSPANYTRIFDISGALKNNVGAITGGGTAYSFQGFAVSNTLVFEIVSSTNSGSANVGAISTPYLASTGTWTHVTWVLTGSSWTLYINSAVVTPTINTAISVYLPPTTYNNGIYPNFFIGRSSWINDSYTTGNFSDFRMYTSALTASQVASMYNSGNGVLGSPWTSTVGTQANWHKLAMSSTGQYITGCINNSGIAGNGILTSVVPTDRIAVSNVATVTENTATTMMAYNDGSVSQSAQTPLGPLDYTTFGQTWTAPDINKTFTSSPTVAMSGTGQVQALSTNPVTLSPLTIMSGLQLWYDAADPNGTGVTPTAQTTISTWVDKSGNGRNAAVTGTFTVIPNTMNGLPVVSMTNPAYWASNYATATVNGATVFPTYFNVISVYRVVTNVNYNTPWAYTTPNLMGYPLDQYNDNRYINSGANGSSYNISAAYGTVLVSQLFNSNYAEYLNGSTTASLTSGPPNSQATLFKIGTRYDNFTTFYGYMCEIIAYNTQMTTANQQTLEGYLAWKWGIQGNLPAAHPYKYLNPLAPTNVPFSLTSGLQLWLDASSLTLANGAVVSSWPTSGGTPYTFTSSNATYLKNAQNGLGVVSFAAGQSGIVSNFALGTTQTMFMLTYAVGQTSSAVFLEHNLINTSPGFLLWTGNAANYGINTGGGLVYVNGANVTVANTWMLLEGMNPDASNSNQMSFYLNGALYASGTAQSGSTVTSTLYFNNPDRVSQPSYLAELLIYNAALTASQRQQVEGYLAWKWGIQSSLPATHMYRYINPSAPITIPYSLTSGLQLWLDASTLHAANGAVVSNWPTVAGTPYTFTSSNATYVANAQNGRGVVYFGAGQSGTVANFVLGQTQTIFMLTYAVGQGTASLFLEHGPNENSNPGLYLYSGGGNSYALNTGSGQIGIDSGNVTVANVWQLIEGMNPDPANSNRMAFYVNGALSTSGATQSGTTTVTNTLYFNNAGRVSYACYLAEILIYNVALSGAQRQQVEGYLMHKWGIQTYLPAGHSFKAIHPSNTIVSSNYGQTWIVAAISISNWASMATSVNGQYQVACINGGSIWYSSTSGSVWLPSGASSLVWSCIAMSGSGQYASACVNGGAIWYSSSYGQTWTASSSGSYAWSCITMSTSGEYQFACHSTSSGGIMISTTYGQTWILITGTTFGTIPVLCCSASGQYVYVGSSTGIYYSANYGISWMFAVLTSGPTWSSIKCTASGQYVLGTNSASAGSAYVSTDYGKTWTIVSNTGFTCGSSALSASGQYMLLATPFTLYQSVTRIGAVSLGASSQQAITYSPSSYLIGPNSYVLLPGGIILQMGSLVLSVVQHTQVSQTVTFPKPFRTACCSIVLSLEDTGPGAAYTTLGVMPQLITRTNFLCMMKYVAGNSQPAGYSTTIRWQAVGY